jgi:hypothetical protein
VSLLSYLNINNEDSNEIVNEFKNRIRILVKYIDQLRNNLIKEFSTNGCEKKRIIKSLNNNGLAFIN